MSRRLISWLVAAVVLLCTTSAWACPYCVGKDQDGIASTLVIVAMVSVPFFIVAATGVLIRRANMGQQLEREGAVVSETSEVC
ncbi:MAG: hypothetical protein QF464_05965 [Myxococcota bacterium]|nr:hypothetical protein [Myxococcota bacterium]